MRLHLRDRSDATPRPTSTCIWRTSILTYSRSRGLFAGVSLEGSTLRPDNKGNQALYG